MQVGVSTGSSVNQHVKNSDATLEWMGSSLVLVVNQINHKNSQKQATLEASNSKSVSTANYPLTRVTQSELAELRKKRVPTFVFKGNGHLYYTEIPFDLNFISYKAIGGHMCAQERNGSICNRLSPAKDDEGGCQKVRETRSRKIENYPWILSGYQTTNTILDAFVVTQCEHYEKTPPKGKKSISEVNASIDNLGKFYLG